MAPGPGRPFVLVSTRRPAHGHGRHGQRPRHAPRDAGPAARGPPGRRLPHRQHRLAGTDLVPAQRHRAGARRFPGRAPRGGHRQRLDGHRAGPARRPRHHDEPGSAPSTTAAYGVRVTGPSTDRPITGIGTTGNGSFGIGDRQADRPQVTACTTADGSGGLELSQSRDVTVAGLTAADEPAGVFTHVNTTERRARPADGHRRAAGRGGREDHAQPDAAGVDDPGARSPASPPAARTSSCATWR